MNGRRVVLTGIGLVSPFGTDLQGFWESLIAGRSGVRRITKFDPSGLDSQIAAEVTGFDPEQFISRKDIRRLDAFSQYAVAAAELAVRDAGLTLPGGDPSRGGVIVGSGIGGLKTLEDQHSVLLEKGPARCSPFMIPQMICNMAAGLIAIRFELRGANYSVVSACASALHAIGDAMRLIQRGDADLMICGGAEATITPLGMAGFCAMKALSTRNGEPERASRPFDAGRDGFIMGEGSAILVLEDMDHAAGRGARIYAEMAGFGMTCDAYHMTAPREGGDGAAEAMRLALRDAGLAPAQIDYINAHGTSTQLNDRAETEAIRKALGESDARRVMISSSKSMTGHLLGAAGSLETVVCALAMRHGVVPPTINYETPDPECDLDYVPNRAREHEVRACLNNSLGFGGHNATLALTRI